MMFLVYFCTICSQKIPIMNQIAMLGDDFYRLIKKYEGCRLISYKCPSGVWTIGYGHTAGVVQGMTISQNTADKMLEQDSSWALLAVLRVLPDVRGKKLDALASLAYNIGSGAFQSSTLVAYLKKGITDRKVIAQAWERWCHSKGKVLRGLQRRRTEEVNLFFE